LLAQGKARVRLPGLGLDYPLRDASLAVRRLATIIFVFISRLAFRHSGRQVGGLPGRRRAGVGKRVGARPSK